MENTNNVDAISLNTSGLINAEPNEPLLYTVFKQYEGVIIESLISSFGLDFIMHDQHGGNVDTVHNVNQIGKDPLMTYKNKQNELDYQNRGEYDSDTVHKNKEFANVKHEAREKFQETGIPIVDEYTGGNLYFYGKGKGDNAAKSAELDHIVSGKAVNDDRGRVLAGNSTEELANIKVNFAFTNKSLNCSMGADEIPDYIAKHPELPEEQKQAMLKKYNKAKAEIDRRNRIKYCTSSQFRKDLARSAGKSALKCGAKQALGLVFAEIWFCIKDVMFKSKDELDDDKGMSSFITKIGNAIKKGIENAKAKYKEIISKFFTGGLSGALSDITTTLCNIFFTTGKNLIKIIRQSYISVVEAGKILIFNPDNLLFGEKVLAAVKILSTGASIVVGGLVTDAIGKTPLVMVPVIGDIVRTFCGSLTTGIISCTLLFLLDRSKIVKKAVDFLNGLSLNSIAMIYREAAEKYEAYCAELMKLDIEQYKAQVKLYTEHSDELISASSDPVEFNKVLKSVVKKLGIKPPWGDDFNGFMDNPENVMVIN